MKSGSTVLWVIIALVLIIIIGYAVYAYNKRKQEEEKIRARNEQLNFLVAPTSTSQGGNGILSVLGTFYPWLNVLNKNK